MVAPESFRNGANVINFYQVDNASGATSLSPIMFESRNKVELTDETKEPMHLIFNSMRLPVLSTGNHGEINIVGNEITNQVRFTGWSACSRNGSIAVFDSDTDPVAGELNYYNQATQLFKTKQVKRNREALVENTNKVAIIPGQVYDFWDDAQALLCAGAGWSKASDTLGRWNALNGATLSFTSRSHEIPLELIVQCSPFFVKDNHELQAIEVSFTSGNKQLITLQSGETDGRFVIHIAPADIGPDGKVDLRLKFTDVASPKSFVMHDDPRPFAIKIKTLQVLITGWLSPFKRTSHRSMYCRG